MIGSTGIRSGSGLRLDALGIAHIAFLGGFLMHNSDHFRQARGIGGTPTAVFWAGMALVPLVFASFALTMSRHPRAALVATVVGFLTALGAAASHLAPHWSALSDPYAGLSLDAYSWIAMWSEIVGGVVLGVVGLRTLAARPGGAGGRA